MSADRGRDAPDVVVVGAAARDVDASDPRGWRLGGGVTYSSRIVAALGLSVGAVMGLDGEAAEAREVAELEAAGVRIRRVPLQSGPIFDNRNEGGRRVQIAHAVSDPVPVDAFPIEWSDACAVIINPVSGEIGQEWAAAMPERALVAIDLQGLVRRLVPGQPVEAIALEPGPLLERADLISISAEDAVAGGPTIDRIVHRDGQELVVHHGPRGSLRFRRSGDALRVDSIPVVAATPSGDGTGAGDTFLAAWVVGSVVRRAMGDGPSDTRALQLAATAATLIVEGRSVDRASIREVARR